jgi:hypothetical protein
MVPQEHVESSVRPATLTIPELEQSKAAVLNTLASVHSRRSYAFAIDRFRGLQEATSGHGTRDDAPRKIAPGAAPEQFLIALLVAYPRTTSAALLGYFRILGDMLIVIRSTSGASRV